MLNRLPPTPVLPHILPRSASRSNQWVFPAPSVRRLAALVLCWLVLGSRSNAAALTWDANTATAGAQDGAGTWNATNANWYNGTADVVWPNATDTAVFGAGTTGTYSVTLGTVNAGALSFTQGGYSLTGGTLTLNPPSPPGGFTVSTAGGTTTINSALAGGAGTRLTKTGAGTLAIGNISGGTATNPTVGIVTGGTYSAATGSFDSILSVPFANVFGTLPTSPTTQILLDSGTLAFTGTNSAAVGTNRTIKVSTAGGAIIDNGGNQFYGQILDNAGSNTSFYFTNSAGKTSTFANTAVVSGPGSVTLNGAGTTVFQAINTYTGATVLNNGTLQLNGGSLGTNTFSAASGTTLSLQGGYLRFDLSISTDRLFVPGNLVTGGVNYLRLGIGNLPTVTPGAFPLVTAAGSLTLAGSYQVDGGASLSVPSTSLIRQFGGTTIPGGGTTTGGTTGGTFYRLTPQPSSTGAQVVIAPAPANVINEMPLGSSITEGISADTNYAGGGYRSQLYQMLVNDGRFSPNFVGSNTVLDNASTSGYNVLLGANQLHHEGHGGYTSAQILTNLNSNPGTGSNNGGYWLSPGGGVNPDYVTVSVGGNDYGGDGTLTTQPLNRVDAIATYIQQLRPGSNVLLGTLFYRTQTTNNNGTTVKVGDLQNMYFNPGLPAVVYNHVLAGHHVSFVDTSSVTPGNSTVNIGPDGIHPLTSGYQILAGTWYNVIAFGSAYWTGSQDGQWSTVNAGGATSFAQNYQLTVPRRTALDAGTDVYFNNNAGALATTLGTDLSVRGVNFAAGAAGPVTVGGGNTLTVGAGGITAQQNTGAHTISASVTAGVTQTWGNVSSNPLTISGNVSGTGKITTTNSYTVQVPIAADNSGTTTQTYTGTGTVILSGNNTNSGGMNLSSGKLIVNNTSGSGTGTGPVSVGKAATLVNDGSVGGSVLIDGAAGGGGVYGDVVTVNNGGTFDGAATINGRLTVSSGGVVALSSGTLSVSGGVVNNGTVRLAHGASLSVSANGGTNLQGTARRGRGTDSGGTFINNGTLDIISGVLDAPAGFTNNGVVIDSRVVRARSVTMTAGVVEVGIDGYTGHAYQLQRSEALGGAYRNLGSPQSGATGGVLTFQDASPSTAQGFYRVQVDP